MIFVLRIALALVLFASAASAQALDPKLVDPTVNALQAMLKLRDAQVQVLAEQLEALRAKCGDPCKEKKDGDAANPGK